MNLDVWFQDIKLDFDDLKWLQLKNNCLEHWSQLENLLAQLHNNEDTGKFSTVVSDMSLVEHASKIILNISTEANKDICTFLVEQLKLLMETPNQQRFSSSLIVSAYTLLIKSTAIYEHVRNNMLILPSSWHLYQLSIVMSESSESNSYLATKVKYLNPKELHVNILLDEIHIKPYITYKNSKLSGVTDEGATATSLHCFMISSLLLSNKDVAVLIPAKNLTAENLCNILKSLLKRLVEAQYNVINIISDGNKINKKLFTLFAGYSLMAELPSWVVNSFNDQQCIFLLFDSVHILTLVNALETIG